MKDISLRIQEGMKKAKEYNKYLFFNIQPFIGKRILEIGCSIGNITDFFIDKGFVCGIDIIEEAVKTINKKYKKKKNFKAVLLNAEDKKILKLKRYNFDTIVCINVLEHIEKDTLTLRYFYKLLKKKGRLLLIVPAHKWLYGSVDKSDHHYRRYTKKEVIKKVKGAGFKIKRIHYFNFFGIFGWFLNGKILKKEMVDSSMLSFYDKLFPILVRIEKFFPGLIGLSIVCIAEK